MWGGSFETAGPTNVSKLARFNGTGWAAVGGGLSGTANGCALCTGPEALGMLAAGSRLFVTGDFLNTGNGPAKNVAVFDTDTQKWTTLGSGLVNVGVVHGSALAIGFDGLYVGGTFEQAGAYPATSISTWYGVVDAMTFDGQGGVLQSDDGVKLTLPNGAVSGLVEIRYAPLDNGGLELPQAVAPLHAFRMTATDEAGAAVNKFTKPYTLQVPYMGEHGANDESLNVLTRQNGGAWTPLLPCTGCSIDPAAKIVTVQADHFSDFVVTAAIQEEPEPNPNPEPEGSALFAPTLQR